MALLQVISLSLKTLIGAIISCCVLPIFLPLYVIIFALSSFIFILVKIEYGNKAKIASGLDALFGPETHDSYTIVNIALRFAGEMDEHRLKARMFEMIQTSFDIRGRKKYIRLTQIYSKAFGYTIWKDNDGFNIDDHFETVELNELVKGNIRKERSRKNGPVNYDYVDKLNKMTEEEGHYDWNILVQCFLNEVGERKIKPTIPQWQVILLKENDARYTVLYRYHHAIADGVYISRMLMQGYIGVPAEELFQFQPPPSKFDRLVRKFWTFSLFPFTVWNLLAAQKDYSVLHGPKLSGKKNYYLSNSLKFGTLREIRLRTNSSINAILFSCMSASISSHFKRRLTNVKEITVRIPTPLQNLQKAVALKNNFAMLNLKIATPPPRGTSNSNKKEMPEESSCNSLSRLRLMKIVYDNAMRDPTCYSVNFLHKTICSLLPMRVVDFLLPNTGITIEYSNVPGPSKQILFGKENLEEVMFWFPVREPTGLAMSILSYNERFRVALCIDEALLQGEREGNFFITDFENEIQNLLNELYNQHDQSKNLENGNIM